MLTKPRLEQFHCVKMFLCPEIQCQRFCYSYIILRLNLESCFWSWQCSLTIRGSELYNGCWCSFAGLKTSIGIFKSSIAHYTPSGHWADPSHQLPSGTLIGLQASTKHPPGETLTGEVLLSTDCFLLGCERRLSRTMVIEAVCYKRTT